MKRLLRWLLRDELIRAMQMGAEIERASQKWETEQRCEIAFARGEVAGRTAVLEELERLVIERNGRLLESDDVETLKKRAFN